MLLMLPPFTVFFAATIALYCDQLLCKDIQLIAECLGKIACMHTLNKRRCRLGQHTFCPWCDFGVTATVITPVQDNVGCCLVRLAIDAE